MTTDIVYYPNDKLFYISGVKKGNVSHDSDVEDFEKCCEELNECINTFAKPQDTQLSFGDIVSRGIDAIKKIKDKMCLNDFVELKRNFKTALIQKKYNIDINEMSPNINKIFREDEKWWKRIKLGGSHLFSTKATLKGKINALFREFVNSDDLNDNYERQFNALFSQLKQHKENKQKKINNNRYDSSKSIGLNTAFDNGHEQEFNV